MPALDSSCDLDDGVVWTSIIRSERTVLCWGSLEVCQRPGELEMQRRKKHTFAVFGAMYAFFLMTSL